MEKYKQALKMVRSQLEQKSSGIIFVQLSHFDKKEEESREGDPAKLDGIAIPAGRSSVVI